MKWVRLNRLSCGSAHVGDTMKLWGTEESAMCACGQLTQSVKDVVADCVIHNSHVGFACFRRLDADN